MKELIGHKTQWDQLSRIYSSGRLAHAYLFSGPAGIGKRTFAQKLAQGILCQMHRPPGEIVPCGTCPPCKQVEACTHPDLFQIGLIEGKRELVIDQFLGAPELRGRTGLCYDLSRSAVYGQHKIALIDDAQALNLESANALLKTLEEPPPKSLIILIVHNLESVLPTIRSRCQLVHFQPLQEHELSRLILEQGHTRDLEEAGEIARLSEGSISRAIQFLSPESRSIRETIQNVIAKQDWDSNALSAKIKEFIESTSDTPEQRELAKNCFSVFVDSYRGRCRFLAGNDDPSTDFEIDLLQDQLHRILKAEEQLDQNLGVGLCIDGLCHDLVSIERDALRGT